MQLKSLTASKQHSGGSNPPNHHKDMAMNTKTETDVAEKSKTKVKLSPPREHKVIYLNDEVTPMDFVIGSLMDIFEHDFETAENLTFRVHEQGSAVVAVLPYEIAEHKGIEVTVSARTNGYPLQVKIEPE
jgi:ATP-dependent Clp protease adaptor protein ClpS